MRSADHRTGRRIGYDVDPSVFLLVGVFGASITIDNCGIATSAAREDAVAKVSDASVPSCAAWTHMSSMRMIDLAGQSRKSLLSLASSILPVSSTAAVPYGARTLAARG